MSNPRPPFNQDAVLGAQEGKVLAVPAHRGVALDEGGATKELGVWPWWAGPQRGVS